MNETGVIAVQPHAKLDGVTVSTFHRDPGCPQIAAVGGTVTGPGTAADAFECDYCAEAYWGARMQEREYAEDLAVAEYKSNRDGNGTGTRRTAEGPTEKQAAFLRRLLTDSGVNADEQIAVLVSNGEWTKRHVSGHIDALLAAAKATQPTPATGSPVSSSVRPNRYAGACRKCGGHIDAEAGELVGGPGSWGVEHVGPCPAKVDAPVYDAPPAPSGHAVLADVPAGHYAIESTGNNDLAFYRVDRPEKGTYAGRTFVKLVVGGHPDQNVRRDAVAGILARIAADPDAGPRYGRELGQCCKCNRHLTDETSRALGIGPECRKKEM